MNSQLDIFDQDLIGLDDEEAAVWSAIRGRLGRESAIKVDVVAWQTKIDSTRVRELVSHLIREHGKLIASSTSNPPGFFVISNEEELRRHIRSLRHRGVSILYRAARLSRTSVTEIFRQTVLEFENGGTVDKKTAP